MAGYDDDALPGFHVPVHRSLTPILLGGAPRAVAIANGTLAAAIALGLRLWLIGAAFWIVGTPRGLGCEARSAVHRGGRRHSVTPPGCGHREGHDVPWRISQSAALLSDFLPWAALVEKGVVLNKDGSFQRTARIRGPDLDSATPAELVGVTARLNNALRRLGSGWAVFVEAQRVGDTLSRERFPDAASQMVDLERREQFEDEGAHFEAGIS
jgi:type IV secretory pathway TrbD component